MYAVPVTIPQVYFGSATTGKAVSESVSISWTSVEPSRR
jgi:hypothetical protein